MKKDEKTLQRYLIQQAKRHGIGADKLESRSRAGWPDIILYYHGRVMFCEIKSERGTGRLTRLQELCIAELRAHLLDVRAIASEEQVEQAVADMLAD